MCDFILGNINMTKIKALDKLNHLLIEELLLPDYEPNNNQEYDKWYRKVEDIFESIPHINKYVIELKKSKFKDNPTQRAFDVAWKGTAEIDKYKKAIKDTHSLIESVYDKVKEWDDDISVNIQTAKNEKPTDITINVLNDKPKTKVFIVHGHDELAISQVSEVLRKLNLEPIVLRDQISRSDTVIEKIERLSSDIGFGIILYTACDLGGKDSNSLEPRARQNVLLEHGYLMAKIGRENTLALKKGHIETPSDIQGLVYTPMDEHKAWQYKLVDELKASGYNVSKDSI